MINNRISARNLDFAPPERKYTDNVHKLPEPTHTDDSIKAVLMDFGKKHQPEIISAIAVLVIAITIMK